MTDGASSIPPRRSTARTMARVLVGGLVLLFLVAGASTSGFGGILLVLGLTALLIGGLALIPGRARWAWLNARRPAAFTAALGLVATVVGAQIAPTPETVPVAVAASQETVQPSPSPSVPSAAPTPEAAPLTTSPSPVQATVTKVASAAVPTVVVTRTATVGTRRVTKPTPSVRRTHRATPTRTRTAPTPTRTRTTRPGVVHPGAFCSPVGARGVTVRGTPMRCTMKAGDDRARWRAA